MSDLKHRASTRIGYHTKIEILTSHGKTLEAKSENLGMWGLLVKSGELKMNGTCRVIISLPGNIDTPQLDIAGQVVRINQQDEAAILFKKLDLETFVQLKDIISANDGDPEKIQEEFLEYIKSHVIKETGRK